MSDEYLDKHIFTCKKLASKLANAKAKLELLTCGVDSGLFSSLRVHVGKFYTDNGLEEKKSVILKNCQNELLELSRVEAVNNLRICRENLRTFFEKDDVQSLGTENYKVLADICYSYESSVIIQLFKRHERKVNRFEQRACDKSKVKMPVKPDKKIRHRTKLRVWWHERQKLKRQKVSSQKQKCLDEKLVKIKSSNLVMNLSSQDIPDEMYFYLALGSTFVPAKTYDKHDFVFDAKNFCRKLAWSYYFSSNSTEDGSSTSPTPIILSLCLLMMLLITMNWRNMCKFV